MSTGKRIALILPVLVVASIVAQNYTLKVTGDFPGANFGTPPIAYANISSAEPEEARAFMVSWGSCSVTPENHNICVSVSGLAPKSAVRFERTESMSIDLDLPGLTVLFSATGQDCSKDGCVPFVPASVPLKGTLSAYTGLGSSMEQFSGTSRQDATYVFGMTTSSTFTGSRIRRSARYSGIVGSVTLEAGAAGSEGTLYTYRGQQVSSMVYPPAP